MTRWKLSGKSSLDDWNPDIWSTVAGSGEDYTPVASIKKLSMHVEKLSVKNRS